MSDVIFYASATCNVCGQHKEGSDIKEIIDWGDYHECDEDDNED